MDTEEGLAIIDTTVMEDLYLLLESIRKLGFDPMNIKKIFLTHAHMDHDGAARALKEMTGAELYLSKEDEDWRHRPEADMHDTGFKIVPYDVDHFYDDNEAIVMGSVTIRTKLSAGHTPSHPSHSNMLSLIPENRMDYTPFVDADKWPVIRKSNRESRRPRKWILDLEAVTRGQSFKYPKERALQIPLAKAASFGYFRSADSSSVTSSGGVSCGHPADRMGRWALPCGICPSGTRCPTGCRRRC